MNLMKVASAISGQVMGGDAVFDQVTTDTRALSGGELFVALEGERFDGHDFVSEAKRSGAAAAMKLGDAGAGRRAQRAAAAQGCMYSAWCCGTVAL